MIWALVLFVYVQGAQTLDPQLSRLDISPRPELTAKACDDAGQLLRGPLLAETDPARQYVWQDYQCIKLEGL